MKRALCALLMLVSGTARAQRQPEWIQFSLKVKTLFSEMYPYSIADSVFMARKPDGFMPPVQHLTRPAKGTLEADTQKIRDEILANLGVDQKMGSTLQMKGGAFKGGAAKTLPGWTMQYQSAAADQQTYVTCLAVVKDKQILHAVYVQAFQTSLPKCTEKLVELARSPDLL